ncbi:hypothetical protein REPUB_Repub07fG0210700 [Reevesia pubescens]
MNRFRPLFLIHHRCLHHLQNAGPLCSHLKSRSVIQFSGPDTIKFLQGLLTNDVRGLGEPPREDNSPIPTPNVASVVVPPMYAALLTPQGRFLYDFFLYRPPLPDEKLDRTGSGPGRGGGSFEILADVDGSILHELLATLKKYRLRSKVDIENVAEDFSCWQRYGRNLSGKTPAFEEPEAASVGWGSGVDGSGKSASHGNDVGWQWFKDPRLDCPGFRGIFPSATAPPLVESDKETDEENYLLSMEIREGGGGKSCPGSQVINTVSCKKAGSVTTALGSRGMGVLRLDEAFKGSGSLTIEGQEDIKVEAVRPDWWPTEWFQDQEHTAVA